MDSNSVETKHLIKNEKDLEDLAKKVLAVALNNLNDETTYATVFALQGDLGAGKTTFTKNLAKILGITDSVTSPTFVIQKTFEIKNIPSDLIQNDDTQNFSFKNLIHIDSYRLDLSSELEHLGWHNTLNNKENLIVIEWPERVQDLLPKKYLLLKFEHVDETTRSVEVREIKN